MSSSFVEFNMGFADKEPYPFSATVSLIDVVLQTEDRNDEVYAIIIPTGRSL